MTKHQEVGVGTPDPKAGVVGSSEKRGFAALRRAAVEHDLDDDEEDTATMDAGNAAGSLSRSEIGNKIVAAALRRATTAADRRRILRDPRPAVVVITVASSAWIETVERYLNGIKRDWYVVARTGTDRRHTTNVGNEGVAKALLWGRSVIGVATDPERQLPRTLTAAADVQIELGDLDTGSVGTAMRSRFPGAAVAVPPDALTALQLDDVVAAMRPGVSPEEAIELMRRASRRRSAGNDVSTAPNLDTAIEFGAAREFGLALAQDIRDFKEGRQSWADSMKGALFFGKPGTGKSVLCASIAAAAGVPLLRFSVASVFEKNSHLGTVIEAFKNLMNQAASIGSCCIVVLEEIEFIPRRDRLDDRGGKSFWLPIIDLVMLLTDAGIAANEPNGGAGRPVGIFILGCTNHLDMVEPALLRPNRLEVAVEVTPPDAAGVANVLRFHLGGALAGEDVSAVARSLEGATAAQCMAVVRAAKRAARHAGRPMVLADLAEAAHGDDVSSPQVVWRSAVHEAAHAVATIVTGEGGLVYVFIQNHGGYTKVKGDQDDLPTLAAIERTAVCLLAAGAAEASIVGSLSTGWSGTDRSDLGRVALLLSHVHASSGLVGNLFVRANMGEALEAARADPELRRAVEDHVRRLYARAVALVGRHRNRIVAVAESLFDKRHLDAAEVVTILSDIPENWTEVPEDRR
ncbi:AAA family ATPase [Bradyrhizobium sp. 153]|uniref:ATP-binding protein n=1 Tax=Bradyrhizobium sp. 153 TaxID=2782627 RepID=UPI001FF95110|nr:AAA family ATPase [Bradyrhizobium sp. 153]MCK1668987.1 AAA family ATPase [Bradyrhizobium sp. 153]